MLKIKESFDRFRRTIKEKFHVEDKKKHTQQFTFKAGTFYNRKQKRQMNKQRHNYYTKKYASERARKYAFSLL
jgi:hypothetical protein